jgi:hypothetical protein
VIALAPNQVKPAPLILSFLISNKLDLIASITG